jgi:ATP-dependent protease Clp ATPase subunit
MPLLATPLRFAVSTFPGSSIPSQRMVASVCSPNGFNSVTSPPTWGISETVWPVFRKKTAENHTLSPTAQSGIVYIDEIDKIRAGGPGFKDMRLGVQHALLKILEGTVAKVPPLAGYRHRMQPGVPFDTTNVRFICGGAFVGLEDIIAKTLGRGSFRSSSSKSWSGSTVRT